MVLLINRFEFVIFVLSSSGFSPSEIACSEENSKLREICFSEKAEIETENSTS